MLKFRFALLCSLCFLCSSIIVAAENAITRVYPVEISDETVPPGATIRITYHFEAEKSYPHENSVFVHIQDDQPMTINQADHLPPIATDTADWFGKLSYTKTYTVPDDFKDGEYRIVLGLCYRDENGDWHNEPLETGPNVEHDNGSDRCIVGYFRVNKNAKMPEKGTRPAIANENRTNSARFNPRPIITTVLPVEISDKRVPPGARLKLTFNFDAEKAYDVDNSVFVHIKDKDNRTVSQADHIPGIATGSPGWVGKVSYTTEWTVPVEINGKAPEGTYQFQIGLYHKSRGDWVNEPLKAGDGVEPVVTPDGAIYSCIAGSFIVDKNAPMPKGDTEKTPTLDLKGFKLVFEEDFSKPLDVSPWGPNTRWIAHTPWAGDFGDARFMDPKDGFPFTIKDKVLRIEAKKSDAFAEKDQWKRPWAAGLLASCDPKGNGFSLKYGYFEARMKMPSGPGVWPAFWLASTYDRTDSKAGKDGSVEIDVVEYYGHFPSSYRTALHVWEPQPHHGAGASVTTKADEPSSGFHNYGVMVDEEFTTFYFDGVEVWKQPTPKEHDKPLMLLVNLALGSGYSVELTPNPSILEIEHIRAYAQP